MKAILFLFTLCVFLSYESFAEEFCSVPASLKTQIAKSFPQFRLPKTSDNSADDIAYNRQHGGSGCLGVASADFDGDAIDDYALLLTGIHRDQTILVVAAQSRDEWYVKKLYELGSDRSRLYVDTIKAGSYKTVPTVDPSEVEPGEVFSLTSKYPGIVAGRSESGSVAFFRKDKSWVHIWISD